MARQTKKRFIEKRKRLQEKRTTSNHRKVSKVIKRTVNQKELKKLMSELGKKGVEARKKKYGKDYYKKFQQAGAEARKKHKL